jgi:hypothetical protein
MVRSSDRIKSVLNQLGLAQTSKPRAHHASEQSSKTASPRILWRFSSTLNHTDTYPVTPTFFW